MTSETPTPPRDPALRTIAMLADTNPNGDMFGGWLLSQMDLAGSTAARLRARGRVVTIAAEAISFHRPVLVGDEVSCYTEVVRVGRTSIAVRVEVSRRSLDHPQAEPVTEGTFTYVHVDELGRPQPVPGDSGEQ